ncbi:MAG: hypothetical protein COB09_17105 [Thalassobium sp.]|nr:MAG: hypothetical protein COB09_17105 [Thalassobium sp.]
MVKTQLPLTGGFYVSRSLPISAQECTNLYVHINQGGGLADESLWGTPGSNQLATTGTNQQVNRGSHNKGGIPYFVNGDMLYRLNRTVDAQSVESFTTTSLGTIEGDGRVSMADNGNQLCILVPGGKGYIFDENAGTPFQEITDSDFTANGNPQHVVFIDGFFLFTTDSKKFIVSNLNNGLVYTATDFGTAEADPDDIVAPVVSNNQLYITGTETIEVFRNAGGSGFPFVRVEGGALNVGVFAAFSLANVSDSFFFIGGSENEKPSIYQSSGGNVQLVSTDGINVILELLTEVQLSGVSALHYSEAGSRFVGWILPTTTIFYDMTSGRWHERKSLFIDEGVSSLTRWRANSMVKAYSRILIGDAVDGRVGEIDLDIFGEYGADIISTIATVPFSNNGDRILVPEIELTIESGVGNSDVTDPKIWMDRSLDGKTYTDPRIRSMGKIGEFNHRSIWRRNGRAERFEVFRFGCSDQVKKVFIKLEADIK